MVLTLLLNATTPGGFFISLAYSKDLFHQICKTTEHNAHPWLRSRVFSENEKVGQSEQSKS
jgi:hypothetical protein